VLLPIDGVEGEGAPTYNDVALLEAEDRQHDAIRQELFPLCEDLVHRQSVLGTGRHGGKPGAARGTVGRQWLPAVEMRITKAQDFGRMVSTMPVHGIWHWVVYDAKVLFIESLVKNKEERKGGEREEDAGTLGEVRARNQSNVALLTWLADVSLLTCHFFLLLLFSFLLSLFILHQPL
jgi:hypothetical protein